MAWSQEKTEGIITGLASGASAFMGNAKIADTSSIRSEIEDLNNTEIQGDDNDSLMAEYNSHIPLRSNYTTKDIRGISSDGMILNTTMGALGGAQGGSAFGPWGVLGGTVIGGGLGIAGIFAGNAKARDEAASINADAEAANNLYMRNFYTKAGNVKDKMFRNAALNLAALGGSLNTYTASRLLTKNFRMKHKSLKYGGFGNYFAYGGDLSGDWSNGVTIITEGGTHEQNPYEGVFIGVDNEGTPNLVEEGEVIFNDYVFSNRLKPTQKQLDDVKLDTKFEGLTFAEIAQEVQKDSEMRPLDPISKNTLVDSMSKLTAIQEETRAKKAQRQFMREFRSMTPEEQQSTLMQMMPQEEPQQAEMMSEQDAMGILNGRTPRAYQGIRNEMGSEAFEQEYRFGGKVNIGANGLPYNNTNGFKYFNNGAYDAGYLEWLNNNKFEGTAGEALFNNLSEIYKQYYPNDTLTKEKAIQLGQDQKFGQFHNILGTAYSRSLDTLPTLETPKGLLTKAEVSNPKNNLDTSKSGETDTLNDIQAPKSNLLQAAPVFGSLLSVIGDLTGMNDPDYSNVDRIAKARRSIRDIRPRSIGNYMQYNPFDTHFEENGLRSSAAGVQRNILNATSGNRGQAIASLLPLFGNETTQLGQLYRQARENNDTQRRTVADFNRGTDLQNAQMGMQAAQINANLDAQRAQLAIQEAQLRDSLEAASLQAKSQNLTNLFNNLGALGHQIYGANQEKFLLDNGYFPNITSKKSEGGKVRKKKRLLR